MKITHLATVIVALFLFTCPVTAQDRFIDGVELTTTKAPWTMRILGNDLDITDVQPKPDEASSYFMMVSDSSKLNVSVFIEPIDKCKTSEECRDYVLNLGNPAWGKYEQLAKGKFKDFSYFEFYRPDVQGRPVKMLDMYAEFVSQGYWVDLHISKTLYAKEDHALFEKVVNSAIFLTKSDKAATLFDAQVAKSQSTASSWLELWDSMKCRESYLALSPLTRIDTTEGSWVDYCTKVNKTLGTRSRKLIATAFTHSLPGKTDQPVAIFAYHSKSDFKPSFVEILGLMTEKNGSWSITNYLPQ